MTLSTPVNQGGRMKRAYVTIPAAVVLLIVLVPFFRQPAPAFFLILFGLVALLANISNAATERRRAIAVAEAPALAAQREADLAARIVREGLDPEAVAAARVRYEAELARLRAERSKGH